MDTAELLASVAASAATDQVAQVLQVYEAVMKVYAASESRYQAALQATSPINGFATSTTGPAQ